MSAAISTLPKNITVPTIETFDPNSAPVLQFGLFGQGVNLADISDYVTNVVGAGHRARGRRGHGAPSTGRRPSGSLSCSADVLQGLQPARPGRGECHAKLYRLRHAHRTIVKNENDLTFQLPGPASSMHSKSAVSSSIPQGHPRGSVGTLAEFQACL